jgi:hypothetical protein
VLRAVSDRCSESCLTTCPLFGGNLRGRAVERSALYLTGRGASIKFRSDGTGEQDYSTHKLLNLPTQTSATITFTR